MTPELVSLQWLRFGLMSSGIELQVCRSLHMAVFVSARCAEVSEGLALIHCSAVLQVLAGATVP